MKTYSVKDIADMLGTNQETVRRWIRAGKLKAGQNSRKDGNMVREDDLYKYLRSSSKYAGIAAGLAAANPFLALTTVVGASILGIVITALTSNGAKSEDEVRILSDDVKQTLLRSIAESRDAIERKQAAIAELREEIDKEERQIKDCEIALEHLEDALQLSINKVL